MKRILLICLLAYAIPCRVLPQCSPALLPANDPNIPNKPFYVKLAAQISLNGGTEWDQLMNGSPLPPFLFDSITKNVRIFHQMDGGTGRDYPNGNTPSNYTPSSNAPQFLNPVQNTPGGRKKVDATWNAGTYPNPDMKDFQNRYISLYNQDWTINAALESLPFNDFPHKWFSYTQWGGNYTAVRNNAKNFAIQFAKAYAPFVASQSACQNPNDITSQPKLLTTLTMSNEAWGQPGHLAIREIYRGIIDGFAQYYGSTNPNCWRIKLAIGAFQAAKFDGLKSCGIPSLNNCGKYGALGGIGTDFLDSIATNDILDKVDAIDAHPYAFKCDSIFELSRHPESEASELMYIRHLVKWKALKPAPYNTRKLVVSEIGWDSRKVGARAQAAYLVRVLPIFARYGIQESSIYQAIDEISFPVFFTSAYGSLAAAQTACNNYISANTSGGFVNFHSVNNPPFLYRSSGLRYVTGRASGCFCEPNLNTYTGQQDGYRINGVWDGNNTRKVDSVKPSYRAVRNYKRLVGDAAYGGDKYFLKAVKEADNDTYAYVLGDVNGNPTHLLAWLPNAAAFNGSDVDAEATKLVPLNGTGSFQNLTINTTQPIYLVNDATVIGTLPAGAVVSNTAANIQLKLRRWPILFRLSNPSNCVVAANGTISCGCTPPPAFSITGSSASAPSTLSLAAGSACSGTLTWFNASTNAQVGSGATYLANPATTTAYYAKCTNAGGCVTQSTNNVTVTVGSCGCPAISGYEAGVLAGGKCYYKSIASNKTWAQAQTECTTQGGILVSIETQAEKNTVDGLLTGNAGDQIAYIGLKRDANNVNNFLWESTATLTAANYTNSTVPWEGGQPGTTAANNRGYMAKWQTGGYIPQWGMENGLALRKWILEKNCVTSSRVAVNPLAEATPATAIQVYPNPAKDRLTVVMPSGSGRYVIKLTDGKGQTAITQAAIPGMNVAALSKLAAGIYLLRIEDTSGNTVYSEKIVKE